MYCFFLSRLKTKKKLLEMVLLLGIILNVWQKNALRKMIHIFIQIYFTTDRTTFAGVLVRNVGVLYNPKKNIFW